ncbi:MAG: hypothetical protein PVF27_00720 [Gemmatimonadales bacterium]|jgi:D-alanine-D-alanine ligase
MRIGLAYNQRPNDVGDRSDGGREASPEPPQPVDAFVEWDEPETIDAVANALGLFGEVVPLEAVGDFPRRLAEAHVDLLFNMAEGTHGPNRESHVPAIAEFLGVRYLGSDPLALGLALHKGRAKEVFRQRGVRTPQSWLIEAEDDLPALQAAEYPLFLKPVWEGSSKGIAEANHVATPADATARTLELLATYRQPVLAERYLPGEEYTVAVMGNGAEITALPVIRYRFGGLPPDALPIMGYEAKWLWDVPESPLDILECPAAIAPARERALADLAIRAYRALGCRDWARVDLRLDADDAPHVIEVNPLPGVIPDPIANSCFPCAAAAGGLSYDELIQRAARIAWRRLTGRDLPVASVAGVVS